MKEKRAWDVQTEIISHLLLIASALGEGKERPWTHVRCFIFLQPWYLIPLDGGEQRGQVRK
jgi:hypothetical protein